MYKRQAQKIVFRGTIGIGYRDQNTALPHKGPVPGKHAYALLPVEIGQALKGKGDAAVPGGQTVCCLLYTSR